MEMLKLPGFLVFLLTMTWTTPTLGQSSQRLGPPPEAKTPVLADWDFEFPHPTGPDTFQVFEREDGSVALSRTFRVSGERSLRIHEDPGNGSFSELLGFFDERTEGRVWVQLYVLWTDIHDRSNIALAGPKWFLCFCKNGHAVWLQVGEGRLRHRPAGQWRDLFAPEPFTWYLMRLAYDVDRGSYDLEIYEEGAEQSEPVVQVKHQRNTADADGSSVAFYSFIGDLEDRGDATYYVDDLLVATHPSVLSRPFVAPGRRSYFVERWPAPGAPLPEAERDREDLLWAGRELLTTEGPVAVDPERAADLAFQIDELELARELYQRVLRTPIPEDDPGRYVRILLKLADVHHRLGHAEEERRLREQIYGALGLEELEAAATSTAQP